MSHSQSEEMSRADGSDLEGQAFPQHIRFEDPQTQIPPPNNHRPSVSGAIGPSKQSVALESKEVISLNRPPTFNHQRASRCIRTGSPSKARKPENNLPVHTTDIDGSLEANQRTGIVYLVLGIFNRVDGRPEERLIHVENEDELFRSIFRGIIHLRGVSGFFSLKDVKQFSIFTCNVESGVHRRMRLDTESEDALHQFFMAYDSWSSWSDWFDIDQTNSRIIRRFFFWRKESSALEDRADTDSRTLNLGWTEWIHRALNNGSYHVDIAISPVDGSLAFPHVHSHGSASGIMTGDPKRSANGSAIGNVNGSMPSTHPLRPTSQIDEKPHPVYSLEVVLGWSPRRIGAVVFAPVLISLIVGLVLNSRDWGDGETIEMSWAVGTYVATTGGIIAALMAVVSEIQKPAERIT
ncbi:hypothetical protein BDV97DRAFT_350121 [Delphinella strobiligena]|nr:hypothetical protein BDV97DRAFT_350121 [Delphinella strobiligena]